MYDVVSEHLAPDLLDYHVGWELQRRVHREVVAGLRPDALILCEHPPVYTAGRRTADDERPTDGTPVIDVDRGGRLTWHGPGQLVGYPITRLPEPIDVVAFVRELERVLIAALGRIDITGERVAGRSGVWVRGVSGGFEKIAAIGLRVQDGVTMHGFAVNCANTVEPFARIVPCGIRDAGVTSASRVLGREVSPAEFAALVVAELRTAVAA